jgi:uncharacterized membrane-anchored protein YhcB (DUF1043 family)
MFIGAPCFRVGNNDWLDTLIGLVFGIAMGFLSNKFAQPSSKPTPKAEEKNIGSSDITD